MIGPRNETLSRRSREQDDFKRTETARIREELLTSGEFGQLEADPDANLDDVGLEAETALIGRNNLALNKAADEGFQTLLKERKTQTLDREKDKRLTSDKGRRGTSSKRLTPLNGGRRSTSLGGSAVSSL